MPNPLVPEEVSALISQLAEPRPMRRGSVSERYVKCNKAGCPCADDTDARHGPYYSVTRAVKGRTKSRWLDAEQARQVREQVATGQKFRELVEAYWQACEQWAEPGEAVGVRTSRRTGRRRYRRHPQRPTTTLAEG